MRRRGQGLTEYVLLIAGVALALVGAVRLFRAVVEGAYRGAAAALAAELPGPDGGGAPGGGAAPGGRGRLAPGRLHAHRFSELAGGLEVCRDCGAARQGAD